MDAGWLAIALAMAIVLYALFVGALLAGGRRADARALAGIVPDCAVLCRRLLGDPRVPRGRKLGLAGLLAYLALPIDIVPDFLPVVGQLDDALIAALVLRGLLRASGAQLVREHWPGPEPSLRIVLRLAAAPI
jgi:uncharacterized membrane protein YkvA (DUF1232 family)